MNNPDPATNSPMAAWALIVAAVGAIGVGAILVLSRPPKDPAPREVLAAVASASNTPAVVDAPVAVDPAPPAGEHEAASSETPHTAENANPDGAEYPQAVREAALAAESGDVEAQYTLGAFYFNNSGDHVDHAKAFEWFMRAAEQDHAAAQTRIGLCYMQGAGVAEDHAEALTWFRRGADGGDLQGQLYMAMCARRGVGMASNENEAVRWYRIAEEQDSWEARMALSAIHTTKVARAMSARELITGGGQWPVASQAAHDMVRTVRDLHLGRASYEECLGLILACEEMARQESGDAGQAVMNACLDILDLERFMLEDGMIRYNGQWVSNAAANKEKERWASAASTSASGPPLTPRQVGDPDAAEPQTAVKSVDSITGPASAFRTPSDPRWKTMRRIGDGDRRSFAEPTDPRWRRMQEEGRTIGGASPGAAAR